MALPAWLMVALVPGKRQPSSMEPLLLQCHWCSQQAALAPLLKVLQRPADPPSTTHRPRTESIEFAAAAYSK